MFCGWTIFSLGAPEIHCTPKRYILYTENHDIFQFSDVVNPIFKTLRPRPHVSADFCIRRFFYADTKISASTRSVYELYTTVHTNPIRIRTSQRISQQSMRITKKAEPAIILAPNSRLSFFLSCLFTWGFNTCELEERKKFLLKNTIKNVSIKRKTEKNQLGVFPLFWEVFGVWFLNQIWLEAA